jgi:hypothetical protein
MASSNNNAVSEEVLMLLVRERLAAGYKVRYLPFKGVSMLPMLRQGKDRVELGPLPEKLKKYDLPVYQMPSGKYLMHRVLKVTPTHYICLGDNTLEYETILPEQMIGVVTAFQRNGKRIEVTNPLYRLYCLIWGHTRPVRILYKRFREKTKRRR